jgi:hypothetical protein
MIAGDPAKLAGLERQLLAGSRAQAASWPERFIFAPIEERCANLLLPRIGEPQLLSAGGAALAVAAVPLAMAGWAWGALLALLLSGPVDAVARRIAAVRLATIRRHDAIQAVRAAAAAAVLLLSAHALAIEQGWGWRLVALIAVGMMLLLREERRMLMRAAGQRGSIWLATLDGMIWGFLPFALLGRWAEGLAALAGYGTLSLIIVQRRLSKSLRRMADEKA